MNKLPLPFAGKLVNCAARAANLMMRCGFASPLHRTIRAACSYFDEIAMSDPAAILRSDIV
ncbi:hypothetical protein C7S18_17555 [Ahniella affigens]|uniref:Uncharacterized protein n=1 Tax=Ahniella affigens TaxID=2021234 RepID=A0A2P1PVM0_9GAMM|nr:hypothetical protein C7S18_17555 [Ahniella affigens]